MKNLPLFNINGMIGRGAYEEADFPTAASLVEHLDYLGIERSLVWHVAARDLSPPLGNRRLLEEVEGSGLERRLIPGFVITPACFFEYGVLDFLREQLASGAVRALRITPEVSRFSVREIERLLRELAPFEPALFWDCGNFGTEANLRDFESLAHTFAQMHFIVTQKMWLGFSGVLDLLWRAPNTYIDTSWLHMRDTIELLSAEFGPERVLFGIGGKSHYGAAIAALAHADIDASQRSLIAHGNAERILKLTPYDGPELPVSASDDQKPLWCRLRAGLALENVEVIDAHGHTPPHTRGWIIRENTLEGGMTEMVTRMDRLGIARLILSPEAALFGESLAGNREAEQVLAKYRGRVSGYLVFNPLYADAMVPEFDAFFNREFFVGFKILPSYWKRPLADPGYEPVWQYANRRHLPILIHTWDDRYNSPAMLEPVAAAYPNAVFVLGHSGGGTAGRLEAEALALAHANVYLEFCGSFTTPRPFETSLRLVGSDRVLFGSDTAAHDQAWELGRYLSMPLPDEELLPGLAANMRRILADAGKR